jgi:hypothetical protein
MTAAVLLLAGCSAGNDDTGPVARLAACAAPSASGQVKIEFRQDDKVLASGSIAPGGVFAAPVPATAAVSVYADGKLVGGKSAGDGDVYLGGAGCPDTPG